MSIRVNELDGVIISVSGTKRPVRDAARLSAGATDWHILTKEEVACALFALAYQLGVRNLPQKRSAKEFVRHHLDRLKIGREVMEIPWGSKRFKLPLSKLKPEEVVALKAADP